jgi:rubrerythrin
MAICREKEAREFYLNKANIMGNQRSKELYEYLANEELKHLGYLEKYRDTTKLPIVSAKVHSGQSFTPEFNTDRAKGNEITFGDTGILLAAMRHERKSEYFYSELTKRAKDDVQRNFFEMLAVFERDHYELIDDYLEKITSFRMQT